MKKKLLKYGFCNKVTSERWNSDQLNTFTTYLYSLLGVIAEYNRNHDQKWGQICFKSVQLVRGWSFQNDLLQNPYFSQLWIDEGKKSKHCFRFWVYNIYYFHLQYVITIFSTKSAIVLSLQDEDTNFPTKGQGLGI